MEKIVFASLGTFFILSGIAVFLYNLKRKRKRVSHKMPSGFWFILGMLVTGGYTIYYGLTHDFSANRPLLDDSEFEMIEIKEGDTLEGEAEKNKLDPEAAAEEEKVNLLSEISKSTFGKK